MEFNVTADIEDGVPQVHMAETPFVPHRMRIALIEPSVESFDDAASSNHSLGAQTESVFSDSHGGGAAETRSSSVADDGQQESAKECQDSRIGDDSLTGKIRSRSARDDLHSVEQDDGDSPKNPELVVATGQGFGSARPTHAIKPVLDLGDSDTGIDTKSSGGISAAETQINVPWQRPSDRHPELVSQLTGITDMLPDCLSFNGDGQLEPCTARGRSDDAPVAPDPGSTTQGPPGSMTTSLSCLCATLDAHLSQSDRELCMYAPEGRLCRWWPDSRIYVGIDLNSFPDAYGALVQECLEIVIEEMNSLRLPLYFTYVPHDQPYVFRLTYAGRHERNVGLARSFFPGDHKSNWSLKIFKAAFHIPRETPSYLLTQTHMNNIIGVLRHEFWHILGVGHCDIPANSQYIHYPPRNPEQYAKNDFMRSVIDPNKRWDCDWTPDAVEELREIYSTPAGGRIGGRVVHYVHPHLSQQQSNYEYRFRRFSLTL